MYVRNGSKQLMHLARCFTCGANGARVQHVEAQIVASVDARHHQVNLRLHKAYINQPANTRVPSQSKIERSCMPGILHWIDTQVEPGNAIAAVVKHLYQTGGKGHHH